MTDRRAFLRSIAGAMAAHAGFVRAQKSEVPVIGFLNLASQKDWAPRVDAFRRGLAEAGYAEGRNVVIEFRWAEGNFERLPALAAELVQRRVAVLVATGGGPPVSAAKAATATIPIVFTLGSDPVKLGIVASFNRPGGNATGISFLGLDLTAKRVGVLHEMVPKAATIGLLVNADNPRLTEPEMRTTTDAARDLGLRVSVQSARDERDLKHVFAAFARERVEALMIGTDAWFEAQRSELVALASQHALPTLYPQRESVEAGGLASYGTNLSDAYRQAGIYVGRILHGAKPADLPVLQSSKVELVLNLKTAKTLGLALPQSLLARADEVIQ